MQFLIEYAGRHPVVVGIAICVTLLLMLVRSIVRALQRWEILPDPILPERLRRIWYGVEKSGERSFYRSLSGKDDL